MNKLQLLKKLIKPIYNHTDLSQETLENLIINEILLEEKKGHIIVVRENGFIKDIIIKK